MFGALLPFAPFLVERQRLMIYRKLRPRYAGTALCHQPCSSAFVDASPDIFVDNVHIELSLWDTAGQEEFDRLRSLSYDDTHTIMLCFSVRPPSQFTKSCPRFLAVAGEAPMTLRARSNANANAAN